eukprot:CAMPEP_0195053932 /NCGR_PEP_ID=MMETSP0448-20130528/2947_1 /TAXON_ID=66468 /ORGANISM="Heterocapsa triquestra, Strain CCMP 448" /LENGTH=54 /DNA_ID=CAMNT_0040083313 /DNA_START=1 /DNA_END=165 /DNA_ORIENTATION=-
MAAEIAGLLHRRGERLQPLAMTNGPASPSWGRRPSLVSSICRQGWAPLSASYSE